MAVIGSGRMCYAAGRPFTTSSSLEGDFMAHAGTNTSSTPKTGHSAAAVSDEGLRKVWRSSGTSAAYVAVDLGSSRKPAYVFVDGLNVEAFDIRADGDGNLSTATHTASIALSGPDPLTRRRKYLYTVPGGWTAQRYWGVYIAGATARTDGTGEFQVARIVLVKTLTELQRNWGTPYGYGAGDVAARTTTPGGRTRRASLSEVLAAFELSGDFDKGKYPNAVEQILRYVSLSSDELLLHFPNRDDYRAAALCERPGPGRASDEGPHFRADVSLVEVA